MGPQPCRPSFEAKYSDRIRLAPPLNLKADDVRSFGSAWAGILAAARYRTVKGGPKYLAFYERENVEVLYTPAFTNRPRTPWGERVSPSVIGSNVTWIARFLTVCSA